MKICKDCKWVNRMQADADGTGPGYWHCDSPNNKGTRDLVTGEPVGVMFTFCESHRKGPNGCGEEGKWWEAK